MLGASHRLYAHVHHGYGLNDAFDRSVALLLARQERRAAPSGSGAAGSSPDDIARQQQQQRAGAAAAAADSGSESSGSLTAAEQAGVAASASDKGVAAGTAQTASAGDRRQRALLQAPAALRRRLALSAGRELQQQEQEGVQRSEQAGGERRLGEGKGPPEVAHPCLHAGYSAPYRRLQLDGAAAPDPPLVLLVGR